MAKEITLNDVNKALDRLKEQWKQIHANNQWNWEEIHIDVDQAFLTFLCSVGREDVVKEFDPGGHFWYA